MKFRYRQASASDELYTVLNSNLFLGLCIYLQRQRHAAAPCGSANPSADDRHATLDFEIHPVRIGDRRGGEAHSARQIVGQLAYGLTSESHFRTDKARSGTCPRMTMHLSTSGRCVTARSRCPSHSATARRVRRSCRPPPASSSSVVADSRAFPRLRNRKYPELDVFGGMSVYLNVQLSTLAFDRHLFRCCSYTVRVVCL